MASKLDAFRDEVLKKIRSDKDIAREAGVTIGAVRAYRARASKGTSKVALVTTPVAKTKKTTKKTTAKKRPVVVLPAGVDKQCPACGKQATGEPEIDTLFGFRNVKTKVTDDHPEGRKRIPQSQCKECRRKSVKSSKAKKTTAVAAK